MQVSPALAPRTQPQHPTRNATATASTADQPPGRCTYPSNKNEQRYNNERDNTYNSKGRMDERNTERQYRQHDNRDNRMQGNYRSEHGGEMRGQNRNMQAREDKYPRR